MVLERGRRPERGHYRVTDELDRATATFDLFGHRVVEAIQYESSPLRVLLIGERGGADQVGEQDGREIGCPRSGASASGTAAS